MKIGNREISSSSAPLVIAEIGINHGGDIETAMNMATAAFHSGCEIIKHQTHFVDDEMTDEAKSVYPPNANESIWEIISKSALSQENEIRLKRHVEAMGMIYISTPFSRSAATFLNDIGVLAFKIGSGECNHIPLLKHVASFKKPIILSTGMQDIESITRSVDVLRNSEVKFALLECTNLYPSPPEHVSLKGISELSNAFPGVPIGFSDHSIGPFMSLASIALGACIIERHFTDTRYRVGPDISCSMDPAELSLILSRSKEIHNAMMNPKRRKFEEEAVYRFARGSIVADRDLRQGHVLSERDIWARRPGSGEISVEFFDVLIGATLKNDVAYNQQLKWGDFEQNFPKGAIK